MECLCIFNVWAFCTLLLQVSSAPVQEPEKHYLSSDKESLLKKVQALEKELQDIQLSQASEDDESEKKAALSREQESAKTLSDREQNLVSSLLRRGSTEQAGQDAEDPYKKALSQLLDEQIETGKFEDEPFDDNMLGQEPEDRKLQDDNLIAMLDSLSIDDLNKLLGLFRQNKRVLNTDGGDNTDDDDDAQTIGVRNSAEGENEDDDLDDDFLKDVDELKGKEQGGKSLTPEDLGKAVSYLLDHLSTEDLQTLLGAVRETKREELDEDKMSDKELVEAIENLIGHIDLAELQKIVAALKTRTEDEVAEGDAEKDGLSNRGLEDHLSEDEVMEDLLDFLAGLSIEDLETTILAVHRKKQAMKEAVGKVADEYLNDSSSEDEDGDDDATRELGPCAKEKQDILEQIITARLANKYHVGGDVPNCNEDGYYAPVQCSGSMCYCVDTYGATTGGESTIWQAGSLICSQEEEEAKPEDTELPPDSPTDGTEDEEEDDNGNIEDENPEIEKLERNLLQMLKEEKRRQEANSGGLNM